MCRLYCRCIVLLRIVVTELFHDRHIQFRGLRGEMMHTRYFGLGRVIVCTIGRRIGCLVSWHVKPIQRFARASREREEEQGGGGGCAFPNRGSGFPSKKTRRGSFSGD